MCTSMLTCVYVCARVLWTVDLTDEVAIDTTEAARRDGASGPASGQRAGLCVFVLGRGGT